MIVIEQTSIWVCLNKWDETNISGGFSYHVMWLNVIHTQLLLCVS